VLDATFTQGLVGFVISGPGHATLKNLVVEQRQALKKVGKVPIVARREQ
jgi:hypothetical protein